MGLRGPEVGLTRRTGFQRAKEEQLGVGEDQEGKRGLRER